MSFSVFIDASKVAKRATCIQCGVRSRYRAIAFISRKLSSAKQNGTATERQLSGLMCVLLSFRCYLKGSTIQVFTDSRKLAKLFKTKFLERPKARWLTTFVFCNMRNVSLVKGKVHVLSNPLTRIRDRSCVQQIRCLACLLSELYWKAAIGNYGTVQLSWAHGRCSRRQVAGRSKRTETSRSSCAVLFEERLAPLIQGQTLPTCALSARELWSSHMTRKSRASWPSRTALHALPNSV